MNAEMAKRRAVFACVQALSQSVAQLPLRLFRRPGRDREYLDEHPAALLIDRPIDFLKLRRRRNET